jgi:hypothetical protein
MSEKRRLNMEKHAEGANPRREEVCQAVIDRVAGFCHIENQYVKPECILKEPPLSMDLDGLIYLAKSLRNYVQYYSDQAETLEEKEVEKSGLTVGDLIDIVYERVKLW